MGRPLRAWGSRGGRERSGTGRARGARPRGQKCSKIGGDSCTTRKDQKRHGRAESFRARPTSRRNRHRAGGTEGDGRAQPGRESSAPCPLGGYCPRSERGPRPATPPGPSGVRQGVPHPQRSRSPSPRGWGLPPAGLPTSRAWPPAGDHRRPQSPGLSAQVPGTAQSPHPSTDDPRPAPPTGA